MHNSVIKYSVIKVQHIQELHVLMFAWVCSKLSVFLLHAKYKSALPMCKFDCVCLSLWVSHVMDWTLLHGVFLPFLFFSCLERLLPRYQIFSAKTQLINSLSYIYMIVRLKKKKTFVYCMIDRKAAWIYSRCQATQRATPWSKSLINDFIVLSLFPSPHKTMWK